MGLFTNWKKKYQEAEAEREALGRELVETKADLIRYQDYLKLCEKQVEDATEQLRASAPQPSVAFDVIDRDVFMGYLNNYRNRIRNASPRTRRAKLALWQHWEEEQFQKQLNQYYKTEVDDE